MRSVGQMNSLAYKLTKTQQLTNTSTHKLINSQTHKLINSKTYKPIKLTKLKSLLLFYKTTLSFTPF